MAIKRMDRDGELQLLDNRDFNKFKEYATRFGLLDETTIALRKRRYVKHAKFYFGELGMTLPENQQAELAAAGLVDVVRAYYSQNQFCASAQFALALREHQGLIDGYQAHWGFTYYDAIRTIEKRLEKMVEKIA